MAVLSSSHCCDTSSFANFKDWAKAVSDALAALGLVQTNDSGQVVWTATVLTMTEVAVGATAVYHYSSYTGPAPRIGMSVAVTGFATGGNNVTGVLTAVSGGASGTVTMALATQANEVHAGSGTTTAIAAAPGQNSYVYEIWGLNDTLQATSPFYIKMEYGTGAGASYANLYITVGTGTNGAGSISGNVSTRTSMANSWSGASGATLYECDFCGSTSYFSILMWRLASNNNARVFCVERSKDSAGADTGDYATLIVAGYATVTQQTVFKVGVGTVTTQEINATARWATVLPITATTGSLNNKMHVSPVYALVGQVPYPHLMALVVLTADLTEGSVFTAQVFGVNHNYLFTKGSIPVVGNQGVGYPAIRWE